MSDQQPSAWGGPPPPQQTQPAVNRQCQHCGWPTPAADPVCRNCGIDARAGAGQGVVPPGPVAPPATGVRPAAGPAGLRPYPPVAAPSTNGMAVASLVLGIVAMLTFWVWIGGLLFAPLAIVFGVLGRKEARGGTKSGEGMATAGLVLGILAAVLMVPWGIIVAMS